MPDTWPPPAPVNPRAVSRGEGVFSAYTDVHPDVRFNAGPSNGCHLPTAYSIAFKAAWRLGRVGSPFDPRVYASLRREGYHAVNAYRAARAGHITF
jgi:hypothetical protein